MVRIRIPPTLRRRHLKCQISPRQDSRGVRVDWGRRLAAGAAAASAAAAAAAGAYRQATNISRRRIYIVGPFVLGRRPDLKESHSSDNTADVARPSPAAESPGQSKRVP